MKTNLNLWARRLIVLVNATVIGLFSTYFANAKFPEVGADYKYFIPRLIDTHLHYKVNGLSIQWYTPSFGGGLPAYPNPQQIQFSPTQMLTLFVNPWTAILISIFCFALIGYLGTYFLSRSVLGYHWIPSTLSAAFFSINGFFLEHLAAGHLGYLAFPLLPLFLVALLYPALPVLMVSVVIAILFAVFVYSGGFYSVIFILLSLSITLPLIYLVKPSLFNWPRLGRILGLGVILTIALSGSKLWAVWSFMRFFPRIAIDHYPVTWYNGLIGLGLQLAGTMTLVPLHWLAGRKITSVRSILQGFTGAYLGYWELDLSLSPMLWLVLGLGIITVVIYVLRKPKTALSRPRGFWVAAVLLALATEVAIEFTLARGTIYSHLRELPVLSSLHINPRFGSAFIFPLALLGGITIQHWLNSWKRKYSKVIFLAAMNLLTLASMGAFLMMPLDVMQARTYNVDGLVYIYKTIQQGGKTYPVERIVDQTNDTRVFDKQASNLTPYEALFGYNINGLSLQLHPGSVWEVQDGYFNMTNPTGLVYPQANGTYAFERIKVSDRANMQRFVNRLQPEWKLPFSQHFWDWASLLALIFDLGVLAYFGWRRYRSAH
jgi:hypothetical protein